MNIKARFEGDRTPDRPLTRQAAQTDVPTALSFAARNLALAYHIDDLIERGLVADYTAAARLLQVSQPRLTHLMSLRLLCPDIQAAVVFDELVFGDKELRVLARIADWDEQKATVAGRSARAKPRRVGH